MDVFCVSCVFVGLSWLFGGSDTEEIYYKNWGWVGGGSIENSTVSDCLCWPQLGLLWTCSASKQVIDIGVMVLKKCIIINYYY